MHWFSHHWYPLYIGAAWITRALMVPVMLRRQFTPGASIAWLGIIFLHPYIGLLLYLMVGESRLAPGQTERYRQLVDSYRGPAPAPGTTEHYPSELLCPSCEPIILQARKTGRMPVLGGNQMELIGDTPRLVDRLVADIAAATSEVNLLYYIFFPDETGNRVAQALTVAAGRGVTCRLLVDSFASKRFLRWHGLAAELRNAGIEVVEALPGSPLRRRDLRDHRKLAIIDNRIAYCGSHNMVNPDYGGRRGAPWVDLTGRYTGPIVGELSVVFAENWAFETGKLITARWTDGPTSMSGEILMQVVPTGPADPNESYRRIFLGAVQSANHRLILTTPYFVPDDPTLVSLMMAADRGVEVNLVLPLVPDHLFTAMAGRSHFANLMNSGVRIFQYRPGLIHSKTISVDDSLGIVGSANLDVRSFNLNFELSVLLYGANATRQLRDVQTKYIADSNPVDPAEWKRRPIVGQYAERIVALLSPLL